MCASIALPKLLLLLSEPGRLYKVHLEFLLPCSDYPHFSRQSYTLTKKEKQPHTTPFCRSSCATVSSSLTHFYSFAQSRCPLCFHVYTTSASALFSFFSCALAETLAPLRKEKCFTTGYWHKNYATYWTKILASNTPTHTHTHIHISSTWAPFGVLVFFFY